MRFDVRSLIQCAALLAGLFACNEAVRPGRIELPAARVSGSSPLFLELHLPPDYKLNPAAPSELMLGAAGKKYQTWDSAFLSRSMPGRLELGRIPEAAFREGRDQLRLEGTLHVCQKDDSKICARLRVGQVLEPGPGSAGPLVWRLEAPIW